MPTLVASLVKKHFGKKCYGSVEIEISDEHFRTLYLAAPMMAEAYPLNTIYALPRNLSWYLSRATALPIAPTKSETKLSELLRLLTEVTQEVVPKLKKYHGLIALPLFCYDTSGKEMKIGLFTDYRPTSVLNYSSITPISIFNYVLNDILHTDQTSPVDTDQLLKELTSDNPYQEELITV